MFHTDCRHANDTSPADLNLARSPNILTTSYVHEVASYSAVTLVRKNHDDTAALTVGIAYARAAGQGSFTFLNYHP